MKYKEYVKNIQQASLPGELILPPRGLHAKMNWKKILLSVVLLVIISLGAVYLFVGRRGLPALEGATAAPVNQEVMVYRDPYGIPHIKADNMDDLFFAQGYTQAQDRLWQMDLNRRAAAGRLAEIFGEDFLETDFFLRSLLMRYTAEQAVAQLGTETARALEQYAAGVNYYITQSRSSFSFEFLVLGYEPDPWEIADTLSIGKLMAWDLGGNMETELFLAAALQLLPEDKALDLFPAPPEGGPSVTAGLPADPASGYINTADDTSPGLLCTLEKIASAKGGFPTRERGSNNWVVSGRKTASGQPLLANDMHLGMGIPSTWYQTRLEIPGTLTISGVIFPGIPGVIVGTNGHIAWGVTNLGPDVQDLYIERPHPENNYLFSYDGQWEKAEVLAEDYFVKNWDEPAQREILITRNGPIISGLDSPDEDILSLRWTAHDYTEEIDAIFRFAHAQDWAAFRRAMTYFHVPAQNFVYADKEGNIAYKAAGKIPVRSTGKGLLPVPGWDPAYQWQGYIPFEELPEAINPPGGFLATANNQIAPPDYPYFISQEWSPPYRARTLTRELESGTSWSATGMQQLQYNIFNTQAQELLPTILAKLVQSNVAWRDSEAGALAILQAWAEQPLDDQDLAGPAIYHALYLKMLEVTFLDEMGPGLFEQFKNLLATNTFDRLFLSSEGSPWFADIPGGKQFVVEEAFQKAVAQLESQLGAAPENWQWGEIHDITLKHHLSQIPVVGRFLNDGPYPLDGSRVTVAAASYPLRAPYSVTNAAPWRYVVAFQDGKTAAWENLAGGVCEHPLSPHYRDQTSLWLDGEYIRIYLEAEQMIENTPQVREYRLVPLPLD